MKFLFFRGEEIQLWDEQRTECVKVFVPNNEEEFNKLAEAKKLEFEVSGRDAVQFRQ